MAIKAHLKSILEQSADLMALIGSNKIFSRLVPQRVSPPYVFFYLKGGNSDLLLREDIGETEDIFQFNCIATSSDTAEAMGKAVKKVLHGYRANKPGLVPISLIQVINVFDDDWSLETELYRRIVETEVHHNE